nr:hypothetical protein [Mesorhizobium temperatum]
MAGRPDRQGGGARSLHCCRHLRRHPAPCRHEGFEGHRARRISWRRAATSKAGSLHAVKLHLERRIMLNGNKAIVLSA